MEIKLSQEHALLLRRIQTEKRFTRQRCVKAAALLMIHRGLSVRDIQFSLSFNDNTIRRYVVVFNGRRLIAYFKNGYVPHTGKLAADQDVQLDEHLDVKSIIAYVTEQFGVRYSVHQAS
jgi:hypothetical protein